MIMSWMLLQAGYARRYAAMYRRGGGLTFPSTPQPSAVDFLYFAVTIGTAFSVSDVLVDHRPDALACAGALDGQLLLQRRGGGLRAEHVRRPLTPRCRTVGADLREPKILFAAHRTPVTLNR